MYRKALVARAV